MSSDKLSNVSVNSSDSSASTQGASMTDMPKASSAALISLSIFVVITLVFFSLRPYFIKSSSKLITTCIYFGIIVISQYLTNLSAMHVMCNNWQYGSVFFITIIPWVLVFGVITLVVTMLPSWLIPFSNTFGYAAAKLAGLDDIMKNLALDPNTIKSSANSSGSTLTEEQRKTLDILYFVTKDPSLIVNELTCFSREEKGEDGKTKLVCSDKGNFDKLFNKLTGVVFKQLSGDETKHKERLRSMVQFKEMISEAIWYLLFGTYTVMITNMTIANSGCNTSTALMRERYAKYKKQVKSSKENEAPNRVFVHKS